MAQWVTSPNPLRRPPYVRAVLLCYLCLLASWPVNARPASGCTHAAVIRQSACLTSQEALSDSTNAPILEQGNQLERELNATQVQTYRIPLVAGQYAHCIVDQQGIDVVVSLFDPKKGLVGKVDRPIASQGREAISLIAEMTGLYTLQVQSLEKKVAPGRYTVRLVEVRTAAAHDESRIAAEKAVTAGEGLRSRKTAEDFLCAIEKFEQAVALWRALDDPYEEAIALYGIGFSYRAIGENQKAVNYFAKALQIMRRLGDLYGEAITLSGLGWTYLYLGEYQKALDSFSEALNMRRAIGDSRGEALTLHGIAWVHALSNEPEEALRRFREALSIRRSLNDHQGEALTLIGIGKVNNQIGRPKEALEDLNRALDLLREVKDGYGPADALSGAGWVLISLGEYQRALDDFNQALPLRRTAGDRTGEATTLFGIAEAERRQGNLLNACNSMGAALNTIESLSAPAASPELRMSYFASIQVYYEHYIDLLQSLDRLYPDKGYAAVALQTSERARARSLLDLLAEIKVDIRQDVDAHLLEQERLLQQRLDVAADRQQQLANGKHGNQEINAAAAQVASLTGQYQEIEAQIRAASPRFAALAPPTPLTAAQIQQQLLDANTLLLEYSLGEERSYLWAVTPTTLESFQLPARDAIEAAARRVLELMTARNSLQTGESVEQKRARVARADADYPAAAAALSRMLLAPIMTRLGSKRLLVVPQGELQMIPFGALPLPSSNESGRNVKPLILDHEIASMPSASTLAVLRRETAGRSLAPHKIAIIADPVFSKYDERVRPMTGLGAGKAFSPLTQSKGAGKAEDQSPPDEADGEDPPQHLPRLFATRWEAEQIVADVPADESFKALDFDAKRDLMFGGKLAQYQILHFATHALIDNTHPELSGIALSQVNEAGQDQNGFLRAHEIYGLKLRSELVVLSGCRTGDGKSVKGEGLIGLTRGFMHAGTPRVIVSLWSLNDRAAAEVMVRFYKKMLGPEKAPALAALRSVQVEMLKDKRWQAPYFWAAFVMQGDWL